VAIIRISVILKVLIIEKYYMNITAPKSNLSDVLFKAK
jgi:hypothetical protein